MARGLTDCDSPVRLLVDECLHTSLTDVANKAGFEAHHANWRGWSGLTDRELLNLVVLEEFVFITNNARDFRKLMSEAELHAGLIVIVPKVRPIAQSKLFERALHIEIVGFCFEHSHYLVSWNRQPESAGTTVHEVPDDPLASLVKLLGLETRGA